MQRSGTQNMRENHGRLRRGCICEAGSGFGFYGLSE